MSEEGKKKKDEAPEVHYTVEMIKVGEPVPVEKPFFVCNGFQMQLPDGLVTLHAQVKELQPSSLHRVIEAHGLAVSYDIDPEWTYRMAGSFIQLGWYEAAGQGLFGGRVRENYPGVTEKVVENHEQRLGDYKKALKAGATQATAKKADRASKPRTQGSRYGLTENALLAMQGKTYSLPEDADKAVRSAFAGHKGAAGVIIRFLAAREKDDALGLDVETLTKALVDSGATKSPKPETIARWYLNDLRNKKVVENR